MSTHKETLDAEVAVSVPVAASILGVSRQLGYKLVADGTIPSVRVGQRIVVTTQALRDFIGGVPMSGSNTPLVELR